MSVAHWVLAALALPCLGASLYLLALTALWRRPERLAAARTLPAFVVLVPAHNEERGIGDTVKALLAVEYPPSRRHVVVVADNCSDRTAEIAASHGAEVIVRHDDRRRGKGFALQFAIEALLDRPGSPEWDALAVVDADTDVSPNFLRAFAAHLEAGEQAVQAVYLPRSAGDGGPVSVLTDVALTAFHVVRSGARERLRLSCGLRGNGMAFRRDLLRRVPHTAFSRTEDLEFGVLLGLQGVRVAFAGETAVRGDMPERQAAVAVQRARWIGGRAGVARRFAPALLGEAVRRRSLMLADIACDLIVPPISALLVLGATGLTASVAVAAAGGSPVAVTLWAAACAGLAVHVFHAAHLAGRTRALWRAAWAIPGYAADKFHVTVRSLLPSQDERWVRTLREGEES